MDIFPLFINIYFFCIRITDIVIVEDFWRGLLPFLFLSCILCALVNDFRKL